VSHARDVLPAEDFFRMQPVVGSTRDAKVLRCIGAAERSRLHVIQLEERARRAAMPFHVDVGALLAVAREHLASDGPGDVTLLRCARRRAPWSSRLGKPLPLESDEESVESFLDDHGQVAARIAVPHQVSRAFELRPELGAHGELDLVTTLGQRLDARGRPTRAVRYRQWLSDRCCRQLANLRRNVRSRGSLRHELLDLPLRLSRRCGDELLDVRLREVVSQEDERREMHGSALDVREQRRKALHEPRCVDPTKRRAFAHVQTSHAAPAAPRQCPIAPRSRSLFRARPRRLVDDARETRQRNSWRLRVDATGLVAGSPAELSLTKVTLPVAVACTVAAEVRGSRLPARNHDSGRHKFFT
jgi:hypothetical protein